METLSRADLVVYLQKRIEHLDGPGGAMLRQVITAAGMQHGDTKVTEKLDSELKHLKSLLDLVSGAQASGPVQVVQAKPCRFHTEMLEALKTSHRAIDELMARLSAKDDTFMPAESGWIWDACVNANKVINEANQSE